MRGLWQLTWLEMKVFMREPLGAIGSIVFPVIAFVVLGRIATRGMAMASLPTTGGCSEINSPGARYLPSPKSGTELCSLAPTPR